jgi:hypothetical protein
VIDLVLQAYEIQKFCFARKWQYCFIGGLAVQHWGEPRLTQDIALSLLTGFGGEEEFIDGLLSEFSPRIDNARSFALQARVVLLRSRSGIGIDISLGALPFEEQLVKRALEVEMAPNVSLRLCTAEDLIVLKAFASRPRDWEDVKATIVRQRKNGLDWEYIEQQLVPLCDLKEEPEIVSRLLSIRQSVEQFGT